MYLSRATHLNSHRDLKKNGVEDLMMITVAFGWIVAFSAV